MNEKSLKNKDFKQKFVLMFSLFSIFCLIFASAGVSYAYLTGKFSSDVTYNNPSGGVELYYNSSTVLTESSTIVLTVSSAGALTFKVNGTAISGTTSSGATTYSLPISIKNTGNLSGKVTSFKVITSSSSTFPLSGVSFTTASGYTLSDGSLTPSSGGDLEISMSENSSVSIITNFVVSDIATSCVGEHSFTFQYEFQQN